MPLNLRDFIPHPQGRSPPKPLVDHLRVRQAHVVIRPEPFTRSYQGSSSFCLPLRTVCSLSVASFFILPGLVRICASSSPLPPPPGSNAQSQDLWHELGKLKKSWATHCKPPGRGTSLCSPLWLLFLLSGVASPACLPSLPRIFFSSFSLSSPHFLVSKDCMSHFTLSCQMSDAVGLRVEANFFPLLKESSGLMKAPNSVILEFLGGGGWLHQLVPLLRGSCQLPPPPLHS